MSKLPVQALQGFVAAARLRNLTRAAERMHVTVSALSHQMRGLEERLGRQLLVRNSRGIALTADGECLLEAVGPAFDAIERALHPLRRKRDEVLTVSVMPTVATSWLVPRLGAFVARHPQLELNLQSSTALVDFQRDPVDAALRFGPGGWPNLVAEHLFDDWIAPVASPKLVGKRARPAPDRLGEWPLLGDPGGRWGDWFAQFGGTPPARYVASFDNSETLHRAAVEGLGVALARMTMARPLIEAGHLVTLMPQCLRAEFSHYLVYPERSRDHAGLALFRTWLLEEAHAYARSDACAVPPKPRGKRSPAGSA